MNNRPLKLVVLVTHPIQYYAPLYRRLTERGIIDLEVIYLSDAGAKAHIDPGFARTVQWDVPLLEGYAYHVLQPGTSITSRRFWHVYDHRLYSILERTNPDWLLIYGYTSRMNWAAMRWGRRHHVKLAYTSDSNIHRTEHWVPLKKLVIRHFFRHIDAFLSPSERNVEYLLKYHADRRRVRRIPFAIDIARFSPANPNEACRYDFIWVGKFLGFKRADDFIDALEVLAQRSESTIHACIAGDGPDRDDLQARARQLPKHCKVDFVGFVNQSSMPALLQSAQTLVFTSERDAYGLVATEAAAAGLALVVAENNGCVGATVVAQPDRNALTYMAGDIAALANAMGRMLHEDGLCSRMQHASQDVAQYHDIEDAAKVIEQVIGQGRHHE